MSAEKALLEANLRLKSGGIGLTIEVHKNYLCLQGSLPPRPDSDRQADYQQRIYLGYPVSAGRERKTS